MPPEPMTPSAPNPISRIFRVRPSLLTSGEGGSCPFRNLPTRLLDSRGIGDIALRQRRGSVRQAKLRGSAHECNYPVPSRQRLSHQLAPSTAGCSKDDDVHSATRLAGAKVCDDYAAPRITESFSEIARVPMTHVVRPRQGELDYQYFATGRTSTPPPRRAAGIREATLIAASRLSASKT
jgi:hypothetical protein